MANQRKGMDRRLLEFIERRLLLCERDDGETRLVAYLATSKDRTFIGFQNWPDGEAYTSCTFIPRPVRRSQKNGSQWKVGPWTLRYISNTKDADNDAAMAAIRVLRYETENKVDFDGLMDKAEEVLAKHEFD